MHNPPHPGEILGAIWLAMGNEYRWLLALKKPQAKN